MAEDTFTDISLMTFGAHKGKRMIDIPATYLLYLNQKGWITDKRVQQYVNSNLEVLEKEARAAGKHY